MRTPFEYPVRPHKRRHCPPTFRDYREYKPYLRDEFVFTCVYCLTREVWWLIHRNLGVEHWHAKATHVSERADYANLLYVCNFCNNRRGTKLLKETWHPEKHPWGEHLRVLEDGTLEGLTGRGRAIVKALHLNHDELVPIRKRYLESYTDLIALWNCHLKEVKETAERILKREFGYPDPSMMPDLTTARGADTPYCSRSGLRDWY